MSTSTIDYDALAAQHGGSAAIDYDALAAQHGGSPSGQAGFFESAANSSGLSALAHPIDTITGLPAAIKGMVSDSIANVKQGVADYKTSGLSQTTRRDFGRAVPIIGPALATAQAQHDAGNNAGMAGTLTGTVAGLAGPKILKEVAPMVPGAIGSTGAATADIAERVKQYIRPTSSLSIVPRTEMAARNLSAAVLPAGKDAANFIKAAGQEVPNVLDYAKRTGNPLNTQLEFSKAAKGYAQDVLDLKNAIEEPVKGKLAKTTGTGFGDRMHEGPDTYATIGDIDKRIVELNKQLDAPAANADDARRALASKTDLANEAAGLKKILHRELADASGLTPDQVADIRQRAGRSFELANDTEAAVMTRMQAEGKASMGPLHWGQIPTRAVEMVRGGPVTVADRAFQKAISNFPGQASRLPEVSQPAIPAPANIDRLEQLLSTARKQQQGARNAQFYPPISPQ